MSDLNSIEKFNKNLGEEGWAEAEERLTRYCNLRTTQRDNSYQIANVLLTGGPATSYAHGAVITTTVDLSTMLENISTAVQQRIQNSLIVAANDRLTVTKSSQDSAQKLILKLNLESPDQNTIDNAITSLNGIAATLNLYMKSGVAPNDGTLSAHPTPFTVTTQTALSLTDNDKIRGDAKLSAILESLLEETELQDMQNELRSRRSRGDLDPNNVGRAKLQYLRNLYGKQANRNFDEIHKYVNLMNSVREDDENLKDYCTRTTNEMVTLLIYSNLISSPTDKTDADVELDYSKLKNDIKLSIENNNFMLPSTVEQRLIEIWREAIGASGLASKKRKMFQMVRNNPTNDKGEKKHSDTGPKKRNKGKKKQWSPPKGKCFTKKAKCCFKCRRFDYKANNGYYGWNEMSVIGRPPHRADACTRTE
jgi:hypothetical protein